MDVSSFRFWPVITHFGSAGLMLPVFAITVGGLWISRRRAALYAWLLALVSGAALVLASKLAFMGWGMGSAALDFTGISGHAMLASSILPIWLGWLLAVSGDRFSVAGLALGLGLGTLVAISRVVLGAHSVSEAVAGWALGGAVALFSGRALTGPLRWSRWSLLALLPLALSLDAATANYLPAYQWEQRIAIRLSGRSAPYTRADLLSGSIPGRAQIVGGQGVPRLGSLQTR